MTFIIQKLFPFYIIDKHLPENTVTKANRQWKKFWLRKFFLFKHWSTQPYDHYKIRHTGPSVDKDGASRWFRYIDAGTINNHIASDYLILR